jgi:hypothetical protein
MSIVHSDGQQDLLNEAVEAHQNGAAIFVARIVVPWGSNQAASAAVPDVAEQIEAIERVGWRLEFLNEFRQFRLGADKQGVYCMFRKHQW